ncbi:MAG: hypothetical protein OXH66_14350 [Gemmatimonadetes bacterium]|nr:hypothetical protein [Gemmatimonadota bacterium]
MPHTPRHRPDPWEAFAKGENPWGKPSGRVGVQSPPPQEPDDDVQNPWETFAKGGNPWDDQYPVVAAEPEPEGPSLGERIAAPFKAFGRGVNIGATATLPQLAGNLMETIGGTGMGSGQRFQEIASKHLPQAFEPPAPDTGPGALRRAVAGAGRDLEEYGEERGEELAGRYGESPGFTEAPFSWLAENVGQALPSTLPAIAAGVAGGPAGALAAGAAMGIGDIRGELEDAGMEPGPEMDALIAAGAIPYALADRLMPARVGAAIREGGGERGLEALFRAAVRSGAEEGFAEGAQSAISQGAAALGTGQDIDWGRIGEEAVRGAAAGPFFGAGGQALASRRQARQEPAQDDSAFEPEALPPEFEPEVVEPTADPFEEFARGKPFPEDTQADTEPVTEAVTEPAPEPVTATESAPSPVTEAVTEPDTEPGTFERMFGGRQPEQPQAAPEPEPEVQPEPTWTEGTIEPEPGAVEPKRQRSVFPGDDRKVETEYQVVEADRIRASHTPNFSQRPAHEFPPEIQGRAYHGRRGRQAREHTEQIVTQFDPERALDPTLQVSEGPPVVTPSGIVVAGNGRTIAQQRLYEGRPDAGQAYKTAIMDRAGDFGIDPAAVAGMDKPVVVRRIVDPGVDVTDVSTLRELNTSSDQPVGKTKDPLSQAATKAAAFREAKGALEHFAMTAEPDATINSYLGTKDGREFLRALVDDGVITRAERAGFIDANTGVPTDEGKKLVERMFYLAALGDADTVSRAPAAALRKLDTSLPAIIRADQAGGDWEIGGLVREALDLLASARATGMKLADFTAQSDFERPPPPADVVNMAEFLDQKKAAVRDAFRAYANRAEEASRETSSHDMFGYEPPPASDARNIFRQAALEPRAVSAAQAQMDIFGFVAAPAPEREQRRDRPHQNQTGLWGDRNPELAEGWTELGQAQPGRYVFRDPEGNIHTAASNRLDQATGIPESATGGRDPATDARNIFAQEDELGSGNLFEEASQAGSPSRVPSSGIFSESRRESERGTPEVSTRPTGSLDLTQPEPSHSSVQPRSVEGSSTIRNATPSLNVADSPTTRFAIEQTPEGRNILQPGDDWQELKRAAEDLLPSYTTALSKAVQTVPGATGQKQRVKADARLLEKLDQRGHAGTISDYLGGMLSIDSMEDGDRVLEAMAEQGWTLPEGEAADEVFVEDGGKGGYRARHVQLLSPDGRLTAELQLVPKEIYEVKDKAHDLYKVFRSTEASTSERKRAKAESKALFDEAWAKFEERAGTEAKAEPLDKPLRRPAGVHPLAPTSEWHHVSTAAAPFETFDPEKVGKGKGGQLYGWGFYVSEGKPLPGHGTSAGFPTRMRVEYQRDPSTILDYDKPIAEQSDVVKAAADALGVDHSKTGADLYAAAAAPAGTEQYRDHYNDPDSPPWPLVVKEGTRWGMSAQLEQRQASETLVEHGIYAATTREHLGDGTTTKAATGIVYDPEAIRLIPEDRPKSGTHALAPTDRPKNIFEPDRPLPLAPTAQMSERLRDAGTFREGTDMNPPNPTEIVRDLQKVLHKALPGVKVAEGGNIIKRALAVVTARSQVVRTRSLSDVQAVAHEYGHLMQKLMFGGDARGDISEAQLAGLPGAVRGELEDLARGVGGPRLTEGWAEFWRRYLDNPASLDEAPNAREYIENRLNEYPAVRNAWQDARDQWAVYRDASPQGRLRRRISVGESDPEAMSIANKWSRFRTNVFDDFEPIRQVLQHVRDRTGGEVTLAEDAEKLARLTRGATGIADMFIGERKGDRFIGGTLAFGSSEKTGKSLAEILEPVTGDLDNFRDYMVARRAQELHKRNLMTGIRDEDVRWTLKHLDSEQFRKAFEDLQDYNTSLLQYLADSGVISQESLAKIQKVNRNYVPFYRVHEGKAGGPGGASGFGTLWSPVNRLKGSGRDIIDPLESIIKNTYSYVQLAQKQRVSTALAALAEKEGVGDLLEQVLTPMRPTQFKLGEIEADLRETVPGFETLVTEMRELGTDPTGELLAVFRPGDYFGKPNTISVLKDGRRQWFEVDPELYKSLEGMETEQLDGWVRWLSKPARWLRAGATLAPEFLIRNPLRDQVMGFIQSEYGYRPFWDLGRGVFEFVKRGDMYEDFMASGAHRGTLLGLDRDSQQRNLDKLVKSGGVPNVVKNPLDMLAALSEIMEVGTRMGEFMRAREKGADLEEAGSAAREISIDFARHGAKTTALRNLSAFWNARLQGYDRLARSIRTDPAGFAARTFAAVTLPSLMEYFAYRDDEEYWEIPQWQRDIFWVAKVGDTWLRIPKPFELGLVFGTLPVRVLSAIDGTPGGSEEVRRFFEDTLSKEVTSIGPTPTAVMPLVENMTNWSFFMQRPIVPRSEQQVRAREQGGERTSDAAKMLARWSPGPQGISPRKIDNLLHSWTGGLGRIATESRDLARHVVNDGPPKPAPTLADIPGVRGVVARSPGLSSESVERVYRRLERARTARATLKHFQREQRWDDFEREARDPEQAALRARLPQYEGAADTFSRIRAQQEMIRRDEKMSPSEKRTRIEELGDQAIEVARGVLQGGG